MCCMILRDANMQWVITGQIYVLLEGKQTVVETFEEGNLKKQKIKIILC